MILWDLNDLEDELSPEVVRQLADDDNDGSANDSVILRLQRRSCARVLGDLTGVYPTLPTLVEGWQDEPASVPTRLRDLALDYAVAVLARRHPEYVRRDWRALMDHYDAQIAAIRKTGLAGLGVVGTPEPAANQGGEAWAGGDDLTETVTQVFNGPGAMGDY